MAGIALYEECRKLWFVGWALPTVPQTWLNIEVFKISFLIFDYEVLMGQKSLKSFLQDLVDLRIFPLLLVFDEHRHDTP